MAMSHGRDRLEVMILEAHGLLAVEGGAANPYVSVEVGEERRRTAVETNTVSPVWDEEIMVFSETTLRNVEHVVLMVKHHDPVGTQTDRTLGMVIVDTATALQAPEIPTQEWFPIRKGPGMKAGDAPQGKVHVKVTYFVDSLGDIERICVEDEDEDDVSAKTPNVVTVLVEAARNLRPPGSKGLCDPFVVVRCGGKAKQCKALKRTNNPKWHFQAHLGNIDPQELLLVEVMHSGTMSNKLVGQARLTMVEIAQAGESLTRWLPLLDDSWGFDAVGRGEVGVTARWHYDKHFTRRQTVLGSTFMGGKAKRERERKALETMVEEFEYEDDNDEEDRERRGEAAVTSGGGGDDDDERGELEEEERARESQALAAKAELEERLEAVKPGDYQLQVHVIEVSDLKGKDSSGTSDPIVYASCLGTTKHTRIRKGVNSAVFDEVLYFNLPNLSRDQLMQATVNLRVLDANTFLRDSLIGSYQFDLLGIYVEKGHEVYRSWVALRDSESGKESGVQGFLKLSVTVLGPGDRQRVHDLAEEIQEELAKEAEAGAGGRGGLVLMGPALISQDLRFLVVYVFLAQGLPSFSAVGVPSVNALVQVDFAGNPPVRSTAVKVKGRDGLSPAWAQELWVPVMVPTHSTSIDLSVWHKEITGREVVAHAYFDFNAVASMPGKPTGGEKRMGLFRRRVKQYPGPPPQWVNLYGAPAGKSRGKEAEIMNRYPTRGSAYRGRVLIAMRVEPRPPSKLGNKGKRGAMDFELSPEEILPETARYTLRALVLQGSDIPVFKFPNAQGASKMRVVVTLGPTKLEFKAKSNRKGIVEWNQGEEVHMLELPADPAQIPEIFVYLVRDIPESRVSYCRIPAVDVLRQRFRGEPYWQELVADRTRQGLWAVGSDNFPGSLLIRLGLGRDVVARHNPWEEMLTLAQENESKPLQNAVVGTSAFIAAINAEDDGDAADKAPAATAVATQGLLGRKKPYCLRTHVFQCRGLPSSEASGLLDPYIKVRFMGRKQKTKHEGSTADPCFYQTVEFHEMLPGDLRFAPEIRVEVWDKDVFGSNTHVAGCRFPMSAATLCRGSTSHVPTPKWYQLIPKRTVHDKFPKAPDITPTFRTAYLEVITVGVRDLKPYGFQAVAQPYVQFDMTSGGERVSFTTHASKFPSGKNANFADRKVRTVLLPENPLFAPQLCIRVHDKRMSGLNNPVVGTCSVAIAYKMPWNDAEYRPPQSQSFSTRKGMASGYSSNNSADNRGASTPSRDRDKYNKDQEDEGRSLRRSPFRTRKRSPKLPEGVGKAEDRTADGSNSEGHHNGAVHHSNRDEEGRTSNSLASNANNNQRRGSGRSSEASDRRPAAADDSYAATGAARESAGEEEGAAATAAASAAARSLTRPANFGVGAVDVAAEGGGGGEGAPQGVGLELPPIEEDQVYRRQVAAIRAAGGEKPRRHGGGQGGIGMKRLPAKAGGKVAGGGRKSSDHAPAWYEQLIIGGGKALGAIDVEEEDKWTLEELGIDFPKEWASNEYLEGRHWWLKRDGGGNEIENFLKHAPFENYPLFLGAEKLKGGARLFRQMSRRKVGLLKGLVVVSENPPDPQTSDFVDMTLLRAPKSYCCRLYVVKGLHLQPKDINGLADPYLRLKIGKLRIDDSKDKDMIHMATLNPEFFRVFEFQVTMPGESQLKLKLYDYDRFGADELIGQTVIDLEDRWFSRGWHDLESQDPIATERRGSKGPYKPLEMRDLSVPTSTNPQGQVMMWLDILTLTQARRYPPVPMEPPSSLKVEVRVVVWRSEDVVACNDFSGLRDLYCRMWMETDSKKKRDTDTHWRCKNGKGSWNYRLKFDVDLPLKSPEHGRMALQMWDRDVLSANDIIAETSLDLYRWFLKVYREQRSTKPFLVIKEARKQKAHEEAMALAAGLPVSGVSNRSTRPTHNGGKHGGRNIGDDKRRRRKRQKRRGKTRDVNNSTDYGGNSDFEGSNTDSGNGGGARSSDSEGSGEGKDAQGDDDDDSSDEDGEGEYYDESDDDGDDGDDHTEAEADDDEEDDGSDEDDEGATDDDTQPLLGGGATQSSEAAQAKMRRPEVDETDEVVSTIKEWFGVGKPPADAQWLELTRRDPEAGTVEQMGKLLISLELLPKENADAQPVGSGRNEPNQNPYLPPPAGRMKFSLNPFRLSMSLLGPKAFYKVLCCCLCVIIAAVIAVAGNYITTFESIF
eukprot:g13738.t1